jgi:hypothetical protein
MGGSDPHPFLGASSLFPLPNEDPPFIGPASAPAAVPRHATHTPVVNDPRAISRLLEMALSKGGLSVSEAARRLDISPQAIRQYIHGRRNPTIAQFIKLLGVTGARLVVEFPK